MIRKLAQSVREYKKLTILSPLFVMLEVIIEVLIPFQMSKIIDNGIAKGDMAYIRNSGYLLVLATLASLTFGVLSGTFSAKASTGFATNVRRDMYHNIQDFSYSNIDTFSVSSLITRLTTDVTNLQNSFQMLIRILFRAPLMLVFSLIMALGINLRLSLVFLAAIPFLGIGLFLIINKAHPIFERVFKTYDRLNNVVQENLSGIRVVKSYVREEHEIEKFKRTSEKIYADFSKAEKILALNNPLMQFAIYTSILLLSWLGAKMVVSDTLTTGQLMSLLTYAMQILMSLMMMSMVFVMIIISRASAERVVAVLNEKSDLHNNENPVYEIPDGSLSFDQVDFSYSHDPEKLALKNVTFSIHAGETIGIIGGTGSGKTTLVQLIPRLYDVTNGTVTVGGIDVRNYDLYTLRSQVGMVLQKNTLFSGTIKDNLRWGNLSATDEELIQAARLAQADEFIQNLPDGYDTFLEEGGTNVSGGQKQRLCIARALVKKPKILILDDSTSAVDTRTESKIRHAFAEEIPSITKFIIAQRISSVEAADKIIVMDNGMINAIGTHAELLASNTIYQEVYYSQIKGGNLHDEA
ncbi:abc transporter [Trichococcus palustris]|uniref:Abc transporter n=1 Tax=Trichococcus palustris TaxID=140314 RepID=A0A143YGN7_9LACT|nr:ABC transporter ATP-binding protein [Trichococcus palustris]CZQ86528.1 abc transporter [Trichococcus palustris]SFK81205.1 ATP-binding cassette, subfamily B [Trichococcus palustris]